MDPLEKELQDFDEGIPAHFERVSKLAFETALESGHPVTIASDGAIWQYVKIDGRVQRTKIKDIEQDVPLGRSKKFTVNL